MIDRRLKVLLYRLEAPCSQLALDPDGRTDLRITIPGAMPDGLVEDLKNSSLSLEIEVRLVYPLRSLKEEKEA